MLILTSEGIMPIVLQTMIILKHILCSVLFHSGIYDFDPLRRASDIVERTTLPFSELCEVELHTLAIS